MLEHWLSPLSDRLVNDCHALGEHTVFKHLIGYVDEMPPLPPDSVAIVGVGKGADHVRTELYQMAWHFGDMPFADIGDVRISNDDSLSQVLSELVDGGVLPLIIGGEDLRPLPQFLTHKGLGRLTNIVVVSERIPHSAANSHSKRGLSPIINQYAHHIFNLGFVAFQSHYCDPVLLGWLEERRYDSMRLGELKARPEEVEPIIRDADMLLFSLDALKQSEAPAVAEPSPSGLFSEEACRICRYAGMSDKLGSFNLFGYRPEKDGEGHTARLVAQMLWYFMDGFANRKGDYPKTVEGMTEYVVGMKGGGYPITFWKSNRSGRWWLQIPAKKGSDRKGMERHELVPCSYRDYQLASSEEIPDRLLQALRRNG